jgi:(1->4)-alpha-D-glucan 1-alpha-D-glucosylmutase
MIQLRATARLQFHRHFPLDRAVALVPYFAQLGVSHIYASPLLMSRPGSTHGYDIVDHNRIDPELGGEPALRRLVAALRARDMGLLLDIVPNHMGVGGVDNAWWLDVLEWGRDSPYASYFDIDWDVPDPALKGKLLAPFLGEPYGTCLRNGDLALCFDAADGRFFVDYGGNRFPIAPRDYPIVLQFAPSAFSRVSLQFAAIQGAGGRVARREASALARVMLRDLARDIGLASTLARFSAAEPGGSERLHLLLERQAWRLAWWRAAADEINWRRFFDVNSLAGMRVDQPEVFEAEHAAVLRLYTEGLIDGVRVDHVDGLPDPRAYCRKLRRRMDAATVERGTTLGLTPGVIWVEKILAPEERLPRDWLTDGTTGYDFMNEAAGVLHDPKGAEPLARLWTKATGRPADFGTEARAARRQILRDSLSSELWAAATALRRVARRKLDTRDYTLTAIRRALEEILVHFPTYRIYAGRGGIGEADRAVLVRAIAGARRTLRFADLPLLDLMQDWLSGDGVRQARPGAERAEWLRAMVRFQQLSAPTAAKSVEDTAFYRYGRLLSRNEVGSDPDQFCLSVGSFHAQCAWRARNYPSGLLATATHDHKRGEDNRARLAVLSEIPEEWEAALARWCRINASLRREIDGGSAPDVADEIMLYETIVGAWPLDLDAADHDGLAAFRVRLRAWQEKALREAKRQSEWARPNDDYEAACYAFMDAVLDPSRPARVCQDMQALVARIAPSGVVNSLTQTVLRLTAPGVPDLYQGCEFWDFSLVDPDNRRSVDYDTRRDALATSVAPAELAGAWRDGRVKQAIIARALGVRACNPELFSRGSYEKIGVQGPAADHVIAFARRLHAKTAIVVASRLTARQLGADATPLLAESFWRETTLHLPRSMLRSVVRDVLGGTTMRAGWEEEARSWSDRSLSLGRLLHRLPVALLELG